MKSIQQYYFCFNYIEHPVHSLIRIYTYAASAMRNYIRSYIFLNYWMWPNEINQALIQGLNPDSRIRRYPFIISFQEMIL